MTHPYICLAIQGLPNQFCQSIQENLTNKFIIIIGTSAHIELQPSAEMFMTTVSVYLSKNLFILICNIYTKPHYQQRFLSKDIYPLISS